MPKIKDLKGMFFGDLEVIEFDRLSKNGAMWKCKCICGNETIVRGGHLTIGAIKSCGNRNQYYEENGCGVIRVHDGKTFIIDIEDAKKVLEHTWFITLGYPKTHSTKLNTKIPVHNIVMDVPDGFLVDHVNHNTLDNRKVNLRVCTKQENSFNKKKIESCSSRFKGVCWNKRKNKWQAEIKFNGKSYFLGYFGNENEAATIYNERAKSFFGEYAYLNEVVK